MLCALAFLLQSCNRCKLDCQNDGILSVDCECVCEDAWTGEECETPACVIACENGGEVTQDCTCDCPSGYIGELCDECEPVVNVVSANSAWNSNGGTNWQNDLEITLPEDYVLTGLGFTAASALVAKGRVINSDGTLGDEVEFRDGPNPSASIAVAYTVPDGYVVTGVGFGETQDVYRLVVNYSALLLSDECDLYLGPELLYDNQANHVVERWLKISDFNYDTRYHCFGGIGIQFADSANRQVETQVRRLLNN